MNNFSPTQVSNILQVKDNIKKALEDFNDTLRSISTIGIIDYTKSYFVSGGCIASLIQGEIPNDFDVYFYHSFNANKIVDTYKKSYTEDIVVVEEKYRDVVPNSNGLCITENAMTLKNKIQVILKHYGYPDTVRKTFDYVHCMPYYDTATDKLYISEEQYDCCVNKILKVNNSLAVTRHRESKFLERGYKNVVNSL